MNLVARTDRCVTRIHIGIAGLQSLLIAGTNARAGDRIRIRPRTLAHTRLFRPGHSASHSSPRIAFAACLYCAGSGCRNDRDRDNEHLELFHDVPFIELVDESGKIRTARFACRGALPPTMHAKGSRTMPS